MKGHGKIKLIANSSGANKSSEKLMLVVPGFETRIPLALDSVSHGEIQT